MAVAANPCHFRQNTCLPPRVVGDCFFLFCPTAARVPFGRDLAGKPARRRSNAVCFVVKEMGKEAEQKNEEHSSIEDAQIKEEEELRVSSKRSLEEKIARKESERRTYLIAAVMSSVAITSMAVASVCYRFSWQMEGGEVPLPVTEMFGTFALSVGAAVSAILVVFSAGLTQWEWSTGRWAHRSLWQMHESHHRPRDGPFELNDVFAIVNAVPAIFLIAYGFFNRGLIPGLCFGAGLGITMFGIAYMFVHDGLVHRRFPVGPIANVPYFRRVAAAHQIHHMDKFEGVPYGLFLGPKELEKVGGLEELEKEMDRKKKLSDL